MCEICDRQTRETALQGHAYRAQQLERMAAFERSIANGHIQPHADRMKAGELLAHALIRYLVEDWL